MKIFVLSDGSPNQLALIKKISGFAEIAAWILYSRENNKKKEKSIIYIKKKILRLFVFSVEYSWIKLQDYYSNQLGEFGIQPKIKVENINDRRVLNLVRDEQPDLVLVSGTNLLKRDLIEEIKKSGKLINLHTGLSPYINGGPNCTNWCLYSGRVDLIGTTVMYLNEGIDSGDIIASEQISITNCKNPFQLHLKLMNSSHELVCKILEIFLRGEECMGTNQGSLSVESRTYFSREWNFWKSILAFLNFYKIRFKDSHVLASTRIPILTFYPTIKGNQGGT